MFNNPFSSNQPKEGRHILPAQFRQGQKEAETFDWALGIIGGVVAVGGGILSLVAGARAADKAFCEWDAKNQK